MLKLNTLNKIQGNPSVYLKALRVVGSAGMTQRNEDHSSSRNKILVANVEQGMECSRPYTANWEAEISTFRIRCGQVGRWVVG